jgi:hypothetical protein
MESPLGTANGLSDSGGAGLRLAAIMVDGDAASACCGDARKELPRVEPSVEPNVDDTEGETGTSGAGTVRRGEEGG